MLKLLNKDKFRLKKKIMRKIKTEKIPKPYHKGKGWVFPSSSSENWKRIWQQKRKNS
jgi:hypothetical protein